MSGLTDIERITDAMAAARADGDWNRESGPGHRPIDPYWVRDIRDICIAAGVPFHHKQWGGHQPKSAGKILDGREWCEIPRAVGEREAAT